MSKDLGTGTWTASKAFGEALLFAVLQVAVALLYWNKAVGPNLAGWFELYADLMRKGFVPYRDFFLFTAPLFPMALAKWFDWTSATVASSFAFGAIHRAAVATSVYVWLRKMGMGAAPALVSVTATSLVAASDTGEPTNYYNHFAIGFVIWSAICAYGSNFQRTPWLLLSGALVGCAVLSKQTIGLAWLLSIVALTVLFSPRSRKLKAACLMAGGAVLPLLALGVWLYANSALAPFWDQVFVSGPTAKGSLTDILVRPLAAWNYPDQRIGLLIGLALGFIALVMAWGDTASVDAGPSVSAIRARLVIVGAALACYGAARLGFSSPFPLASRSYHYAFIFAGVACAVVWFLGPVARFLLKKTSSLPDKAWLGGTLMAACGLSVYVGLAVSFPVYEPMAMPAVLPLIVVPYVWARSRGVSSRAPVHCVAVCLLLLVTAASSFKAHYPFDWAGWREPPVFAKRDREPEGRMGLTRVSEETGSAIKTVLRLIETHSTGPDDVFCFPNLALFYFLTDKVPPTFAPVHYVDVAPDAVVASDLAALQRRPPKVIVMMPFTNTDIQILQGGFRGGRSSAFAEMNNYLLSMTTHYRVAYERPVGETRRLMVLVSRDED